MAGSKRIEAQREARKQAQMEERLRARDEEKRAAEAAAREAEARREEQRVARRQEARREVLEQERALDGEADRKRVRREEVRASQRQEHRRAEHATAQRVLRVRERAEEQRRTRADQEQAKQRGEEQAKERSAGRAADKPADPARQPAPRPARVARDGRVGQGRSAPTPRDDGRAASDRGAKESGVGDKRRAAIDDMRKLAAAPRPGRDKPEKARPSSERADSSRARERRSAERAPATAPAREDRTRAAVPRDRPAEPSSAPDRPGLDEAAAERERPARDRLRVRIPSGQLSGALPWLQTAGNRLVTLEGDVVVLRGLDLPGLEVAGAGVRELSTLVAERTARLMVLLDWGATIVRLPISRPLALDDAGPLPAAGYLAAIDGLIATCAERGAYCLLSLEPKESPGSAPPPVGSDAGLETPIAQTIRLWQRLGERYAGEPAVLFDLLAPPPPGAPLVAADLTSEWEHWRLWVRWLVALLRDAHPRAVVVVAGLDGARDLTGFPVAGRDDEPIPNVIYAAQLQPGEGGLLRTLLAFSRRAPLLVTQWQIGARPGPGQELVAQALAAAGIGWSATSLPRGDAGDLGGGFLRERRGRYEPTFAGCEAQRLLALGRAWEPATKEVRLQ